jgi:hypothetical protein
MTINQAIEALECGVKYTGDSTLRYHCMTKALAALREINPATEEDIHKALGPYHVFTDVPTWRECERFHGIGGE